MSKSKIKYQRDQNAETQKQHFPILPEDQVAYFRAQFSKCNQCSCGFVGLHSEPIQGYTPHGSGWKLPDGSNWWLFVICPNCDHAWSLWMLGVKKNFNQEGS